MKFLDWLSKLGVLRFGVKKGTYTSAKDLPEEFLIDGVYNSKKDLVHKGDFKKK